MKANNLSVSIPNKGCNKNCKYCVSKMTGYGKTDYPNFLRKLSKAKKFADICNVTSVSITGKGEPLLDYNEISKVANVFKDFPLEVQTNGLLFKKDLTLVSYLREIGIDVIAFSIDSFEEMLDFQIVFDAISHLGMTVRLTVNLVPETYEKTPLDYINLCRIFGITQLSFRKISIPTHRINTQESNKAAKYIKENIDEKKVEKFLAQYKALIEYKATPIRELPYGASLKLINNVMVTYFDYCIQDNSKEDDIRSLIYHEDGHLSTSWYGSHVGRIF